jgi:addiction module HigA family antidote
MHKRGLRLKVPQHPGGFIRAEIVEPAKLSAKAATEVLGVTGVALSALLNERASLSPEMALRIEKVFGLSMDTLMRMQNSYDIARTTSREADIGGARHGPQKDSEPPAASAQDRER